MFKSILHLEHVIADKAFKFMCDHDAPIGAIKEALFQMQKIIGHAEDQAKMIQAQQQASLAPQENSPVANPEGEKPEGQ